MSITIAAFIFALVIVFLIIWLVRKGALKEKYAALWIIIGISTLILAGWPKLLADISSLLGVKVASNLLLALGILLLVGVCLHLSWELSRSEERTRILVEEIALLRNRVERLEDGVPKKLLKTQSTQKYPRHRGEVLPRGTAQAPHMKATEAQE